MRTYNINRDLHDTNEIMYDVLNFKQGDSNQEIKISLFNKGASMDLIGVTCTGNFKLSDGSTHTRNLTASGNVVTVVLDSTLLSQTGYNTVEIKLVKGDSTTTTFSIKYRVLASIVFDSVDTGVVIDNDAGGSSSSIVNVDPNSKKYAILVVGGQSNAVGFDESPVSAIFDAHEHPRIKQLSYWTANKEIIPLGHCAENFQDMRGKVNSNSPNFKGTKGIHLPLAKRILKHIPEDYEILVLPCAFGGSSFTDPNDPKGSYDASTMKAPGSERWGLGEPLYMAMKDRLDYVLGLNKENYYLATVWCQGENDFKQPVQQGEKFKEMTNDFFAYFNGKYADRVKGGVWSPSQWFIYETVKYFREPSQHASGEQAALDTQKIWDQYKAWSPTTYVALDFGQTEEEWNAYTNKVRGNGSTVGMNQLHTHFGNDAYERLVAPAVYKKMLENNIF